MPLYPQLGPQYYDEKHKGLLNRIEAFYAESITINQSFWAEADTDWRFFTGDQTLWSDIYGNLPVTRKRQFNFNRIKRIVNMISGHQRKNRRSITVIPVENADQHTADQFTKVINWIERQEGIYDTFSEAFEGALVGGMNLLQVWVDYRSDPLSGNIKVDNCHYNSFLIDPFFKKADLSDCNAIWKRTFLTKRQCISLMPDKAHDIMGLEGGDTGNGRDGKFQFMAESYNYGMRNLLTYDEYYYRDYRTQKLIVDTQTGATVEWKSQQEDMLKEYLRTFPQLTVIESEVPTVRLAIVIQGRVMYDGPNPLGIDQYPFVPVFTYYAPQMPYFPWRIQGIVRNLRDAQYLYNRRKAIELDIMESQLNSGWVYKENALVNPADVFLNGQGKGLALKEEAQMTDVQQIQPPNIPPSTLQLSEILAREIQEISGASDELLQMETKDISGFHAMLRQSASLTTLQPLFDQADASLKLLGKLFIDIIQANFMPGKIERILEEKPSEQFYNKAFGRYGAAVEEGLNTTTQKQMQFAQLLDLREAGIPVPTEVLLEASTMQNKTQLIQAIQRIEQQQAQQAQMQMQVALQEQQARTELAQARAQADIGLGVERMSRVEENKALAIERRAAAVKDQDAGLLDLVKALKEIEDLDLKQIEKLISMANMVKAQQQPVQSGINSMQNVSA